MNKVILMGCLTKDIVATTTANGLKVAKGSIALDKGKDKEGNSKGADFPSIVAFDKTADFLERFGQKGRRFLIEGRLQTGSYQREDGTKVYTTDVVVDRVEFADSKNAQPADVKTENSNDNFVKVADDALDELPFV